MKKGLVIIGVILLIVGLLLMLLLWPMIGTIDGDEMEEKIANGESGTFTVVDEITQDEWDEAGEFGQALMKEFGIDGPGTYTATVELKDGVLQDPEDLEYQRVPTIGGILGLVILIVGVILLIVGAVTGKAAPAPPPQQPPAQQPYQQPYQPPPQQPYQPPPQQPYQPPPQPPPQQPYQPPPPPP